MRQASSVAAKGGLSAKSMIKAKSIAASILNMSEIDLADIMDTDQVRPRSCGSTFYTDVEFRIIYSADYTQKMQHTYNRLSLLQNLKHPKVFWEFCVVIAPEHWGRHLINICLLLGASSLSAETKCGSRRCTVSLDYPLGTDTVDWRWCRGEEMCRKQTLTFSVLFTSI